MDERHLCPIYICISGQKNVAAFESMTEGFARTGRCESASVAYRLQPIAFSAVWISIQIPNNGALTHGELSPLFVNLKEVLVSFKESTWIHLSHVKWIPDKYCQSTACPHSTCLFLRVQSLAFPWS